MRHNRATISALYRFKGPDRVMNYARYAMGALIIGGGALFSGIANIYGIEKAIVQT